MPHEEFSPELLASLSEHRTPFFVFSKQRILNKYAEYNECFPHSLIQYAMKANSEHEILELLAQAGSGFEVASVFELNLLKKIKADPKKIVYGAAVKPAAHIKEFFEYGVDRFAVDSFPELEKIALAAPGSKVFIRQAVNDTGSVFKFSEKFGAEKEQLVPLLQRAKELGLVPYGISFHVGSQASNPLAWSNAVNGLKEILDQLESVGIKIDIINIGGGFPCNSYSSAEQHLTLKEIADHIYTEYKKLPYQPKLMLEPGRGMIADTGILITSVIGKVERRGNTWLFLDAGVYNALFEAMAYQGSTRYRVTSMRPSFDAGEKLFALAGPTGDGPDIITREALLPQDIDTGDKLIIHDVGAYSLVVTSPFNGFPKPEAILI
jgi:ornithine decarboxylase